jgi:hypothetical protein
MIISVHMFAFADEGDRSKVRNVKIPEEYRLAKMGELLEMVFKYGQNCLQPSNYYSVSVGDVVEIRGEYYMVMGQGWKKMTKEQFDNMPVPSSRFAYSLSMKKTFGGEEV